MRRSLWRCSGFLSFFLLKCLCLPPLTAPLCLSPGLIVDLLWGRGCVSRFCLLTHFLKCFPLASLGGGNSSFFLFSVGALYFGECIAPFFFLLDWGSEMGYLYIIVFNDWGFYWVFSLNVCQCFTFSFSSPLYSNNVGENSILNPSIKY